MPRCTYRVTPFRILLALLAMLLISMACLPSPGAAQTRKRVLVLNSYSPGYKWTDDIIKGISSVTRYSKTEISLHHEFMDTKTISDPQYFRLLYQTYRYKFRDKKFDAIVATDNDALNFLLLNRDRLFPGTPVVFCGVNDLEPSRLTGVKLVTGVYEAPDYKATIDLALKLHPKTEQILIINDLTTTGRAVHKDLVDLLPRYRGKVRFTLLEDADMEEVLKTVRDLPEQSVILYSLFFRDKKGRVFDFDESISLITRNSRVPVYGFWDFSLGYGIVGGMLTSGYDQGRSAGQMVMRLLNGERIEALPVMMQSTNRYMFDYRQMERFGIKMSSLPDGSTVINRPLGRYVVQQSTIWGAAVLVAVLIAVILLLLRNMAMKRKAEERLQNFADQLELRVKERTEELELSTITLDEQNRKLQETYEGLRQETADRIRVMEELRQRDQLLIQQSRMAAMGEMLGNIAHQWRQPLNVLGLKIQELTMSYRLGNFSKELLEANVGKSMEILKHMSRTIDDFRTFSTPDKEKITFNVSEVVQKTVSLICETFHSHGIAVEIVSAEEPQVEGYPNEYAQVLLNVLMNAKDAFMERQTAEPRVIIRSSKDEEGRAVVTIADNAGGIDEAVIDKIFDAYFTTKELGKGTGVGLFMSKKIIEAHMGGRLTVRNIEGGAEFTIAI
jgi:signal transduction histidine kinase